jgi:hypothetical protein
LLTVYANSNKFWKTFMSKGDDIEERLINFAVRIINLCAHLPKTQAGEHIGGQLLRSGTSPAANYAEARGAESDKDFILGNSQKIIYQQDTAPNFNIRN